GRRLPVPGRSVSRRESAPSRCSDGSLVSANPLEVDDDLAVHVSAGLELDRGPNLFDWEGRRDRYPDFAGANEAGYLIDGVGGVGAVCGLDAVDLAGDRGDACVWDAEFPCRVHGVDSVEVDRCGDAGGREGADPFDEPFAVGHGMGAEAA